MSDAQNEVILIDLSSIAHPIWHMSQNEPDPNHTSQQIVARVRAMATSKPHIAVCCDAGRSFRKDIAETYKANRPEAEAPLHHQIALACEQLIADGFPVWRVKGFEADDLIASATKQALDASLDVLIVTGDKDLLQLVGDRVHAMSVRDGSILDAAAVVAKFGVKPEQIRDYLTLVGDSSDNIAGAKGIGPKKAAELLTAYGTLDAVYEAMRLHGTQFKPAMATALREFQPRLDQTRALVTLRTDVDLPFAEIANERVPKNIAPMTEMESEMELDVAAEDPQVPLPADEPTRPAPATIPPATPTVAVSSTALAVVPEVELVEPAQYERQLDPRSLKEARTLATDMYQSRLFSAYGTPQGVLSTVMLGRELGLPAMAALRSVHIIEGKHALSASLMVALVLKSGFAEYFEPVSFDDKQATFVTKRNGARNEVTLQHTIEMAKTAGLLKPNSNWEKIPTEMLVARAQARLCRLVYPDVIGGLYTPDELKDSSMTAKVA